MNKRRLMLLFFCAISIGLQGQKFKTQNVKMPIDLPAVDFSMSATDRYKLVMSEALQSIAYNRSNEGGGSFSGLTLSPSLQAKYENSKKGELANYFFEVVSNGISNIIFDKPYLINYEIVNPDMTKVSKKGYVANFSFTLDFKLLVKDKDQNIIRTILISDDKERHQMVYHASFFKSKETFDKWLAFDKLVGFSSIDEFNNSIKNTDPKLVEMRASKNQLEKFLAKAKRAVEICYDVNIYKRSFMSMSFISNVEVGSPLSPLEAAVDSQRVIFSTPLDSNTFTTIASRLQPIIAIYEKYNTEHGRSNQDARKLTHLNLFICYYYSGMFQKAKEIFHTFYTENGWGPSGFGESFDLFCSYSELKQSKNCYYTNSFSESVDLYVKEELEKIKESKRKEQVAKEEAKRKEQVAKEEAEKRKQQSYLIKRKAELIIYKQGTVYGVDGKDYSGIVDMKLGSLPGSGNMIDLDAGKVVNLIDQTTQKLKKYFRLDDIKYILVNDGRYHPIEIATKFLASTKLMKYIDQHKTAELYYEPNEEDYYCKMTTQKKAYKISDLLECSKVTNSFYEMYPALKDKLKDKKVDVKDESALVELIKFIGEAAN